MFSSNSFDVSLGNARRSCVYRVYRMERRRRTIWWNYLLTPNNSVTSFGVPIRTFAACTFRSTISATIQRLARTLPICLATCKACISLNVKCWWPASKARQISWRFLHVRWRMPPWISLFNRCKFSPSSNPPVWVSCLFDIFQVCVHIWSNWISTVAFGSHVLERSLIHFWPFTRHFGGSTWKKRKSTTILSIVFVANWSFWLPSISDYVNTWRSMSWRICWHSRSWMNSWQIARFKQRMKPKNKRRYCHDDLEMCAIHGLPSTNATERRLIQLNCIPHVHCSNSPSLFLYSSLSEWFDCF